MRHFILPAAPCKRRFCICGYRESLEPLTVFAGHSKLSVASVCDGCNHRPLSSMAGNRLWDFAHDTQAVSRCLIDFINLYDCFSFRPCFSMGERTGHFLRLFWKPGSSDQLPLARFEGLSFINGTGSFSDKSMVDWEDDTI